jgi:hypothetical protein
MHRGAGSKNGGVNNMQKLEKRELGLKGADRVGSGIGSVGLQSWAGHWVYEFEMGRLIDQTA